MVNSEEFSKRLQKVFEYYGLNASAFADRIDVGRASISHLLSGRNKPSLDFVMRVIKNFPEVELYWLLNGKGSFPIKQPNQQKPEPLTSTHPEAQHSSSNDNNKLLLQSTTDALGNNSEDIERIVVFFKNGSFKSYNNKSTSE